MWLERDQDERTRQNEGKSRERGGAYCTCKRLPSQLIMRGIDAEPPARNMGNETTSRVGGLRLNAY